MILAFNLADLVQVPFGYLMSVLYQLTTNYGLALILFGILVKIILLPTTAKAKRSTMKMSRLTPRLKEIQKKYADDQQKQGEAMRALYKEEGVSMTGGCLWSFVPLLILFPLYTVVREPIIYMLHESADAAKTIVATIKEAAPDLFSGNSYYEQMTAAPLISSFTEQLKAVLPDLSETTLKGIDFSFLGIDLGVTPSFNIFKWEVYNWKNIGGFLLPLLSAGTQVLSMFLSQKMNNSLVTDERGLQDKEAAKNSDANRQSKMMMWTMPLISLWIGYTIPAALSLYWIVQGLSSTVVDIILTRKYRKIYDAEDAARLQKALEADAVEAEKERLRAEKRAANPDGITENTSKKKLQQIKQREQEASKREAAREYALKKGLETEEEAAPDVLSGDPARPYCKGRAYDPNRYTSDNREE